MNSLKNKIKLLLEQQELAVLSTLNAEFQQPYLNIVAFYNSHDLKKIFFATPKNTTKYKNLIINPKVSILIDNRKNDGSDIGVSSAITIMGNSYEITDNNDKNIQNFISKYPQLDFFFKTPSTAFICVYVKKYILVDKFQDVTELNFK